MKYCFLLIFLTFINFGCSQKTTGHITKFSKDDFKLGILVDVRTPEEFKQGHLDDAVNINWMDTSFDSQVQNLDKNQTIYVYCKKGGRSAKASDRLKSLGFNNVIDLEGGYDAWSASKK